MAAAGPGVPRGAVRLETIVQLPAQFPRLPNPQGIAVAPDGSWFLTDALNQVVWGAARDGAVSVVAGTGIIGGDDGPGAMATFNSPVGVVVNRAGAVFVTESMGCRIRKIVRTVGGGWVVSTMVSVGLNHPRAVALDPTGHLVVLDARRVLRVNPATGTLAVIPTDDIGESFGCPFGVAVDRRGNIFFAEFNGHRLRCISATDSSVTTVAGRGVPGLVDGPGPVAQFMFPRAIVVDGQGELLVGDGLFQSKFQFRRIAASADRTVTTIPVEKSWDNSIFVTAIDNDGALLVSARHTRSVFRVTGLGLTPPVAPIWSPGAHRGIAAAVPAIRPFVTTVILCARRLNTQDSEPDGSALRLPVEMWWAVLAMLRPDQMDHARY